MVKNFRFNTQALRVLARSIIYPAMQIQGILGLGFFVTFLVSVFYYFSPHGYPGENPLVPFFFADICYGVAKLGQRLQRLDPPKPNISLRRGSWIVLVTWTMSVLIASFYFLVGGLPDPAGGISFLSRFIDAVFESLSGFTTTGASILPNIEVFDRSFLFFRSLTHWIGGMGIAYLGVTVWKEFVSSREAIINSESESPDLVSFENNDEARQSGIDFVKAYSVLTLALALLLFFSGLLFRQTPYKYFSDNVYDSVTYSFSVMGTGGFSTYNASAGLPQEQSGGHILPGALQNVTSEWIIAFFMVFAGMNFSLWYLLIFNTKEKWRHVFKNTELRVYFAVIGIATLLIAFFLAKDKVYPGPEETLRYSFFNVATIISTTGLGDWDFVRWPIEAVGVLFICFLVGGMVGSTAGGPKISRFIISYKYLKSQMISFVYGTEDESFSIDGTVYDQKKAGLVASSVAIYYLIFLFGGILLMVFSPFGRQVGGSIANLDFGTAMAASIATLGNIGPAISVTPNFNIGPTGIYFAFTDAGKLIMVVLMYIGRVGVITFLMLSLRTRGEARLISSVPSIKFDPEEPTLHQ